jgi:Uroporphyrinogen decarboxylase (URO-D)
MITMRERFIQTLNFQPAQPPFMRNFGAWEETQDLWRTQGWDGRPLDEVFGTDTLLRVEVYYGPAPQFAYQLLEEDESTRTFVNFEGIVMREFKQHRDTSMPQFIRFPVVDEASFARVEVERLVLNEAERFSDAWKLQVAAMRDTDMPRQCWADRWGGFFGSIRNLMGLEGLCLAFYDQPRLVERMMAQRADSIIAITERILQHTEFETFWFWEDMAYNAGPLIDPRLYRRFALPHYRRVCDWLRAHGIRYIWLDSDGDITNLIPLWLEAGVNGLWPFEVAAGMDVLAVRRKYGHDLAIGGGIDKRAVALGGDTMRQAVDRVMPLVEDGGYLPELDHTAPPDISWQNYCDYMGYLKHRLGRG